MMTDPKMGTIETCDSCGEEIEFIGPYWRHIKFDLRHIATPKGPKCIKEIGDRRVLIQSCWVDNALDIVANIRILDGKEVVHQQRVEISGDQEITYPMFTPYKKIGPHMIHEEFDEFLNDYLGKVLELIFSLLEPKELESLRLGEGPEV